MLPTPLSDIVSIKKSCERIEAKVDHQHNMLHAIVDAISALTLQGNDLDSLAAAGTALRLKQEQLQQALDSFLEESKSPDVKGE